MQALYKNTDGSYSVGVVEGRGTALKLFGYDRGQICPTVQVRFGDTDEQNVERVETLFVSDTALTLGVLYGSQVSALTKHAR